MRRLSKIGIGFLIGWTFNFFVLFLCASTASALNVPGAYGNVAPPAATALPVLKNPTLPIPGVNGIPTPSGNSLLIDQTLPRITIDWASFDIGQNASVRFDQKGNRSWVALNRIWNRDPTQIYGSLTADGTIYLINQNGILFGPGSRVNVNSLIASTLNISNTDFTNGLLKFKMEDYQGTGSINMDAVVSNHGTITAVSTESGAVFLMAPKVENYGSINIPYGQVGLIAGTDVSLLNDRTKTYLRFGDGGTSDADAASLELFKRIQMNAGSVLGEVVNNGTLSADYGLVGLYGGTVRHNGLIQSATSVHARSRVELVASDLIETGAGSRINLPISTDSQEVVKYVEPLLRGYVTLQGWGQTTPVINIYHRGAITAPSGGVYLLAGNRVYLDSGSSIDVSGAWSDKSAADALVIQQLTSKELADNYAQKDAVNGQTVTAYLYQVPGSYIGDLTGAVVNRDLTNSERLIDGGLIQITAIPASGTGDIIAREGSVLNFAGGGIRYSGGTADITRVLIGNKIYMISESLLASVPAAKVLGTFTRSFKRFGVNEVYNGIYFGGSAAVPERVDAFVTGGNAGILNLAASKIVLDGTLDGSVTRGMYQNTSSIAISTDLSMSDSYYVDQVAHPFPVSIASGTEVPHAGVVWIGGIGGGSSAPASPEGALVDSVVLVGNTTLLASTFRETDALQTSTIFLSTGKLNEAGLSTLVLDKVATTVTIAPDVELKLQAGGSFSAAARRIEQYGKILVPSGTISLTIQQNGTSAQTYDNLTAQWVANPNYIPLQERIVLLGNSILDVSGEKQDNSALAGSRSFQTASTKGGTINLYDHTFYGDGVFIFPGATVNVSGGYSISSAGSVTGGNAGTLNIEGSTILLGGALQGYALANYKGGTVSLHALKAQITPAAQSWPQGFLPDSPLTALPASMQHALILQHNLLDDTGFTNITVKSLTDLTVEGNVNLAPSLVRLNQPVPGGAQTAPSMSPYYSGGTPVRDHGDLIRLDSDPFFAAMAGDSAVKLTAAANFTDSNSISLNFMSDIWSSINNTHNSLTIAGGAVISALPKGTVEAKTSSYGAITIEGSLKAPGGNVNVSGASVTLKRGALIDAAGYLKTDMSSIFPGYAPNRTPVGGGSVTLAGAVTLEAGSLIDISGSDLNRNWIRTADGGFVWVNEAGQGGSLTLNLGNSNLVWRGEVLAGSKLASVAGGTLTVSQTNSNAFNQGAVPGLTVKAVPDGSGTLNIQTIIASGFDDVTLQSSNFVNFADSVSATFGRKLTLDAPEIRGGDGAFVNLQAPWIVLANSSEIVANTNATPQNPAGKLYLKSDWIDVNYGVSSYDGSSTINAYSISLTGFPWVYLDAARDIRISSSFVSGSGQKLSTDGRMTLKADRIYPLTGQVFTLHAGGLMEILPADKRTGGPIYSAGGKLTVEGLGGINVWGTLAAPLGVISLSSSGQQVRLYDGSRLSTAGADFNVNYGGLDLNGVWKFTKTSSSNVENADKLAVSGDSKGITVSGGTVIMDPQATIDVSGGGGAFGYAFRSDVAGIVNPITKAGRYIVLSDPSFQLPGDRVYLTGGNGLSAGYYTLINPNDPKHPEYAAYAFLPNAYIVEERTSSVIPNQYTRTIDGYSLMTGYKSTAGTSLQAERPTYYVVRTAADVLKEGTFDVKTLTSGNAGDVSIIGATTLISGTLNAGFLPGYQGGKGTFAGKDIFVNKDPVSQWTSDQLQITADSLSGHGFREIVLGDSSVTVTLTVNSGVDLNNISALTMVANTQISMLEGSQVSADTVTFSGPTSIHSGATVRAASGITVSGVSSLEGDIRFSGNVELGNGAFTLKGSNIFFVADGVTGIGGTYVTHRAWDFLSAFQNVSLISSSDIEFRENRNLAVTGNLTLDAARILGYTNSDGTGVNVTLAAGKNLMIQNSGAASAASAPPLNGSVFTASADSITLGNDVQFGRFSTLSLNAAKELAMIGTGSLSTGGASLSMTASRIRTKLSQDASGVYRAANFVIYTGSNYVLDKASLNPQNTVSTASTGSDWDRTDQAGGSLEIWATSIDHSGVLEVGTGQLRLAAQGAGPTDGIYLRNGSQILAQGTDSAAGGRVVLQSPSGQITAEAGSLIDVTNNGGGAGSVSISGPQKTVSLLGDLRAGSGGSFTLDTLSLSEANLTALAFALASGDFDQLIDIRARTDDLTVASGTTLKSRNIKMTADGNNLNVNGTLDASTADGNGWVELYAQNNVNVNSGGMINASGTASGAKGGDVLLSAVSGTVDVKSGSTINVSAGPGGTNGTIYMRAKRKTELGGDVQINLATDSLIGASAVYAEAFWSYTGSYTSLTTWLDSATTFYNASDDDGTKAVMRLEGAAPGGDATFHLLPGIEWTSTGDISSIGTATVDLTTRRYQTQHDLDVGKLATNKEAGVLTIRAAGNLTINQNLVDHPTAQASLPTSSARRDSWAFNLVAGADVSTTFSSADPLAVVSGTGDFTINDQKAVYTESAPIRFASGRDTKIGRGQDKTSSGDNRLKYMINDSMRYNLATYDGNIRGKAGRDLQITGGAIESAAGNIDLTVGRNLYLNTGQVSDNSAGSASYYILGAIRTTGRVQSATDYQSSGGGSIKADIWGLATKSDGTGSIDPLAWDRGYGLNADVYWGASFGDWQLAYPGSGSYRVYTTAGFAAMGGGNLSIRTGGDFWGQAGTFGQGDLRIQSGGDLVGRFLNMGTPNTPGRMTLVAEGNAGKDDAAYRSATYAAGQKQRPMDIELGNSIASITAGGIIMVGAVVDPAITSVNVTSQSGNKSWRPRYSSNSSISIQAGGGVTLRGENSYYYWYRTGSYNSTNVPTNTKIAQMLIPGTVSIQTDHGDINLIPRDQSYYLVLMPAQNGNLTITADEGSIYGYYKVSSQAPPTKIILSDMDPGIIYAPSTSTQHYTDLPKPASHASSPVHIGDDSGPVVIEAGKGDISNLAFYLSKKANIIADEGSISNVVYDGQHVSDRDISIIRAGRDISFLTKGAGQGSGGTYFYQNGPGLFIVQAGGKIDLGTSDGIQLLGNLLISTIQDSSGCDLVVAAGYKAPVEKNWTKQSAADFLNQLKNYTKQYSEKLAQNQDEAAPLLDKTRTELIEPALGQAPGKGDISMLCTQIVNNSPGGSILMLAGGKVDVGKTVFLSDNTTKGITTTSGGQIGIFAQQDVNVNESRVMTFIGGDITIWSDQGDINAGRGSRAQMNYKPPSYGKDAQGNPTVTFTPPSAGSGIRAVTGDPDGPGPLKAPESGMIYLRAVKIDAGEAGITGNKVYLGSTQVLNSGNITSVSGTVGAPQASASLSLGALTGSGATTEQGKGGDLAGATGAAARALAAGQLMENIMAKWLDVKVIATRQEW